MLGRGGWASRAPRRRLRLLREVTDARGAGLPSVCLGVVGCCGWWGLCADGTLSLVWCGVVLLALCVRRICRASLEIASCHLWRRQLPQADSRPEVSGISFGHHKAVLSSFPLGFASAVCLVAYPFAYLFPHFYFFAASPQTHTHKRQNTNDEADGEEKPCYDLFYSCML